jgi:hypothetical protein
MQSGHENPIRQNNEYEYLQIDEVWRNGEFWLCPSFFYYSTHPNQTCGI